MTFSPTYKKHTNGVCFESRTPRGSSSTSREFDKDFGKVKLESSNKFGYTSDTSLIHKIESLSSEVEEIDQKNLYETPSKFLDLAIQIVSIEPQRSLETDFKTTITNLFSNFNQVVNEVFTTGSNLPIYFESSIGQISLKDWNNTTAKKDVVESSQSNSSDNTFSTSINEGFCEKVEPPSKKTLDLSKGKKPPPLSPNRVSSGTAPMATPRVLNVVSYPLYHGHMDIDPDCCSLSSVPWPYG